MQPDIGEEEGCRDGGGGFSVTFPAPAYQQEAINHYFSVAGNLPPETYYNATGRGYPDIAANFGAVIPYCIVVDDRYIGHPHCPRSVLADISLKEKFLTIYWILQGMKESRAPQLPLRSWLQ